MASYTEKTSWENVRDFLDNIDFEQLGQFLKEQSSNVENLRVIALVCMILATIVIIRAVIKCIKSILECDTC